MMKKNMRRRSIIQILLTILTGSGIFFIYYIDIHKQQAYNSSKQLSPQEILDHAVNSSGIKETKSVKKENNEIIFESHNKD